MGFLYQEIIKNAGRNCTSGLFRVPITDPEETVDLKCSIDGCPGEFEAKEVTHTVRRDGQLIVIDHVPAEVCSFCGDVLLNLDTVRRIESLLEGGVIGPSNGLTRSFAPVWLRLNNAKPR